MEYQINGSFICERCRNICKGPCHDQLTAIMEGDMSHYEENKDLVGRKQIIKCLGKYCPHPCKYQLEDYTPYKEEDGVKPLIGLIEYLGGKVHELLEEKYNNNQK